MTPEIFDTVIRLILKYGSIRAQYSYLPLTGPTRSHADEEIGQTMEDIKRLLRDELSGDKEERK
jgi:hypothetical protein